MPNVRANFTCEGGAVFAALALAKQATRKLVRNIVAKYGAEYVETGRGRQTKQDVKGKGVVWPTFAAPRLSSSL
jgi:hypothetical protein